MPSALSPQHTAPGSLPPNLSNKLPKLTPRPRREAERTTNPPPPPTPALTSPPNLTAHTYSLPRRRILSPHDHELFLSSPTHDLIVSFIFHLSDSVQRTTISDVRKTPAASDPTILSLLSILDSAEALLHACPAIDTGSRFGNPAFRDFLQAVESAQTAWHAKLHITDPHLQTELSAYLTSSFGNGTRIDYGSGHELNFLLWLLCLRQAHLLPDTLFPALALLVFPRYLRLMRDVQSTYYLEPAGSHGVWGLDDYQFLPFLFGASQLLDHAHIRPLSIHHPLILEECGPEFLYLDQIAWVNATKTVQGLRWHSPMLDDISAAKSWAKIEAGMKRMFLAEVLAKLPVAQHFLFGSLLPAAPAMTPDAADHDPALEVTVDGMTHVHNPNSWGDCCGIRVPSAVGARSEEQKVGGGRSAGLRRVPFD